MTATEHIRRLIGGVPEGRPFLLSDVVGKVAEEFGMERAAARNLIQQELRKMLDGGSVIRCHRGVYRTAGKDSAGDACALSAEEACELYLFDLEGRRIGYCADVLRETSGAGRRSVIVTNRRGSGTQPALATEFGLTLVRPKTIVDDGNFEYLALLDSLSLTQDKGLSSKIAEKAFSYMGERGLSLAELMGHASRSYPSDTVLLVASLCAILQNR